MTATFSTSVAGAGEKADFWQDIICRTFVPIDCRFARGRDFRGTLSTRKIGPISCNRIEASSHSAYRSSRNIAAGSDGVLLLSLVTSGVERVSQDGREAVLMPGDMAIHDSTRPYGLSFDTPFSQIVFQMPRELLRQRIGSFERFTAMRLSSQEAVGQLTSNFLLNFAALDDRTDPVVAERLASNAMDLLAMTLTTQLKCEDKSTSSHRAALLYRAKTWIETNLRRPGLGTAEVAETLGYSVRYVNGLFSEEGTTVGDYILNRRLQACREDLAVRAGPHRISDVAYAWGFNNMAHFSRVFKAKFGMSPRQCREVGGSGGGRTLIGE